MEIAGGPVEACVEGAVGVIELNRPEKFNCLSTEVIEGIGKAHSAFESNPAVRAVLLCAKGKYFCTGADLQEVEGLRQDRAALTRFMNRGHAVFCRLEASPLPVVAAVQGLCLAGGMELMLACDVVFAAQSARFGDQHAQYGLVPGWGGSQRLPRLVGLRRGMDLLFSARWIEAAVAEQWGLVNYVCEDGELREKALEYCRAAAERSRGGLAEMKRLAREGMNGTLAAGLRLEVEPAVEALQSADVSEGLAAFGERRKPRFS